MSVIAIVGAGMMGSALCVPLADRGHDVRLIGTPLDGAIVDALATGRLHPTLGAELPASIRCSAESELLAQAEDADAIVLGVSSAGVSWAATALAPVLARRSRPVLMVSKGLQHEGGELRVLTDAFCRALPQELRAGWAVNLGFGISAHVPRVLLEEGRHGDVTWVIEQGAVGGVPLPKSGYERRYYPGTAPANINTNVSGTNSVSGYVYTATPVTSGQTGVRGFGGDASGVLCFSPGGVEPPTNAQDLLDTTNADCNVLS